MDSIKHKINLDNIYDEYGNTNCHKFIEKYSDEIHSGYISQECLDKMAGTVLDIIPTEELDIKDFIRNIYVAIIHTKYFSIIDHRIDTFQVFQAIRAFVYLDNNWIFKSISDEDLNRLSKEVYEELGNDGSTYRDIINEHGFIEEFNTSHLSDLDYYLDKFMEYAKNCNDQESIKILSDQNLRRI